MQKKKNLTCIKVFYTAYLFEPASILFLSDILVICMISKLKIYFIVNAVEISFVYLKNESYK